MSATILCVEDEEGLRNDIVEELRQAGYQTLEAENGQVAFESIVKQKPDLVLCDIIMPVMNGHRLLAEVRATLPERCVLPFIFLSALTDRDSLMKAKGLDVDDYLTKPVDYELLLAAVASRLRRFQHIVKHQPDQPTKGYKAATERAVHAASEAATPTSSARALGPPAPALHSQLSQEGDEAKGAATGGRVEHRLQELATERPTKMVAGRVQLLGLDNVKATLGKRWDRHDEIIFDLIDQTIKERLAPSDVYQRDSHDTFTICFAQLSESEAAFKTRAIAEEIHSKILGKDMGQGGNPLAEAAEAFLDKVVGKSMERLALTVRGEAHEVELDIDDVDESGDLLGYLTSRLEAAGERAKKIEKATMIELADHSALRLHRVEKHDGGGTPFHFATFDRDTQAQIEALRNHRPASADLIRDLDVLLLSRVAEEIFRRPPAKDLVLVVNIHFSTLENEGRLAHLRTICNRLSEPARASLILNIVEIPAGLLPATVAERFLSVRHFCRAMMAQFEAPEFGSIDPQMLRTPVLTFSASDLAKWQTHDPDAVSTFLRQLRRQKLQLLAYRITTARMRGQMRGLGVDFLASE